MSTCPDLGELQGIDGEIVLELVVPYLADSVLVQVIGAVSVRIRQLVRNEMTRRAVHGEWHGRNLIWCTNSKHSDEALRSVISERSILSAISLDFSGTVAQRFFLPHSPVGQLHEDEELLYEAELTGLPMTEDEPNEDIMDDGTSSGPPSDRILNLRRAIEGCRQVISLNLRSPFSVMPDPLQGFLTDIEEREELKILVVDGLQTCPSKFPPSLRVLSVRLCTDGPQTSEAEPLFAVLSRSPLPLLESLSICNATDRSTYTKLPTSLRHLGLNYKGQIGALPESGDLDHLRNLEFISAPSSVLCRYLASAYDTPSSSLRHLICSDEGNLRKLTVADSAAISRFQKLESLHLIESAPSFSILEPVLTGAFAARLRTLSLCRVPLAARGLRLIAKNFPNLEALRVRFCSLDGYAIQHLQELSKLKYLDMRGNSAPLTVYSAADGHSSSPWEEGAELGSTSSEYWSNRTEAGTLTPRLFSVEVLDMSNCNISGMSIWIIAQAFPNLQELIIADGLFASVAGLKTLAGSLTALHLGTRDSPMANAQSILELKNLKTLSLGRRTLSYNALLHLAYHPTLRLLQVWKESFRSASFQSSSYEILIQAFMRNKKNVRIGPEETVLSRRLCQIFCPNEWCYSYANQGMPT